MILITTSLCTGNRTSCYTVPTFILMYRYILESRPSFPFPFRPTKLPKFVTPHTFTASKPNLKGALAAWVSGEELNGGREGGRKEGRLGWHRRSRSADKNFHSIHAPNALSPKSSLLSPFTDTFPHRQSQGRTGGERVDNFAGHACVGMWRSLSASWERARSSTR